EQGQLGMQMPNVVFEKHGVAECGVAVESGVIDPNVAERLFETGAEASSPRLVIGEEEALGRAAADGEDSEVAAEVRGRIRPAEADGIAGHGDDRIESGDDVVIDLVP